MSDADEARVWLAQCLCPSRHAILAASKEARTRAQAQTEIQQPLKAQIDSLLAAGSLNPWCGLCGAKAETWHYEVGRTRFRTMAEAEPELRKAENLNAVTAGLWGDLHRTRRPN